MVDNNGNDINSENEMVNGMYHFQIFKRSNVHNDIILLYTIAIAKISKARNKYSFRT